MDTPNVAAFLVRHAPFDALDDDGLERVATSIQVEFFPSGKEIIQQGGEPAQFLYVIRRGMVEVSDGDQVLDLLGEGEAFGHLSLLSQLSPSAAVRAREDAICYLIDPGVAEAVLGTRQGLAWVTSSLRRQILRVAEAAQRPNPWMVTVGSLIHRRPVTCEADTSIREAAEIMTREGVSSLLVASAEGWGIVTDRDLRSRVLASGAAPATPVGEVMSHPAVTVPVESPAAEVLSLMIEREFHHFPVLDEQGQLLGVVTDTDLLRLDRRSPFALRRAVQRAHDERATAAAGRELPLVVASLVQASADPVEVGRVVGVTVDALTRRFIDLAVADLGPPPVPWAWLVFGSAARYEQALHSDQDHGLAFDPGDRPTSEVDPYFAELARRVTDGLEAAGLPRCKGGTMAENPPFRRSTEQWMAGFKEWTSDVGRAGSMVASIVFDYRRAAGPLDIEPMIDQLIQTASRDRDFVRHLARRALVGRPPTGFFGDLVVKGKGEHAGTLDVKHGGITLITNLARAYGVAAGVEERGTLRRLRGAAAAGRINEEVRRGLEEAFRVLWRARLEHQVASAQRGADQDDLVDPKSLGPLARRDLKESFRIIAQAQRALAAAVGLPR